MCCLQQINDFLLGNNHCCVLAKELEKEDPSIYKNIGTAVFVMASFETACFSVAGFGWRSNRAHD